MSVCWSPLVTVVEVVLDLGGVRCSLLDTTGVRDAIEDGDDRVDDVEVEGMRRARVAARRASRAALQSLESAMQGMREAAAEYRELLEIGADASEADRRFHDFDLQFHEALATAGGNQPHPNLQPYTAINFCIALSGIFPSRD